ncbi:hypothetical protein RJZ56_003248 [Blastomyces dermatitidis]|uniref:Pre-mRNA-splicing factor CWC21 n=1 Tax=Ajellomyces dermatitidis (strain ER-3 / ATCC MYA-2586) TaxID=559297 RepID=A0ABP2F3R1_AJEDR|nr:pre-mRNA-splicing factor CWC21 [Blastomyces dermatitidis ER-3]EEQ91554.1 pre-mRNA-splicing factor CWC21 [Blastomyces dermatitidis ER-3]
MSSNVGLSTPRGSGTSGYVQRNLSFLKPRDAGYGGAPYPPPSATGANTDRQSNGSFKQRKPDQQILEHDRRRAIEVKILEERDRLEEANEGVGGGDKLSEEEIEERLDGIRKRLVGELEEELKGGRLGGGDSRRGQLGARDGERVKGGRKQFKTYQVHELAEAKIEESERLRRALGIRGDGEQGDEWRWGGNGGRRREKKEVGREVGREREREGESDRAGHRDGHRDRERSRDRDRDRDGYQSRSRRDR